MEEAARGGEAPIKQWQVGYQRKPRLGQIVVSGIGEDPRILDCEVSVTGYAGRPISGGKVPGTVTVELPASITVTGPEGVEVIVEAWEVRSIGNDRGMSKSYIPANDIPVPLWAKSFDIGTNATAEFHNAAGAVVGFVTGPVVNFSIPNESSFVVTNGPNLDVIVFRQQG